MRNRTVMGIFDRPSDAEKLKDELLEAGVASHRIVITRSGQAPEAAERSCRMEVVARSPLDRDQIARLMLQHGARETSAAFARNDRQA
jgi:hypothetical protein